MLDISKAFSTQGEPVCEFFQRPGVGFYIPLYQRDYTWNHENIDQLMEDICRGVDILTDDDDAIRFLGTVILVKETNPNVNIDPRDGRALPSSIENIIDGQQRLSTIALLACLLYQRFVQLEARLPQSEPYSDLKESISAEKDTLREIFSVDIKRGKPRRKPIIIRGGTGNDCWTFDGRDEENYRSDVASFLASFITASEKNKDFPRFSGRGRVYDNLKRMDSWLEKVEKAHHGNDEGFPGAKVIVDKIKQEHIWAYERDALKKIVEGIDISSITREQETLCSLIQLFAFTHYLLYRCCFTSIQPSSDDWAFDMFQSLNASGTPLTSVETFKPIVVKGTNHYKESIVEQDFGYVDELLNKITQDAKKNRFTNEFLTAYALVYEGYKLSSQFSIQRRWLSSRYNYCGTDAEKADFIHKMGQHARFYINVQEHKATAGVYKGLENIDGAQYGLVSLLIEYLKDSSHKMANTILGRFYADVLEEVDKADQVFCAATKAIAAFYTLWRASDSNAGLDNVYRTLLKGDSEKKIPAFSWAGNVEQVTVDNLKSYLKNVLLEKGISTQEDWLRKAKQNLRYDKANFICRFALLVAANDTIVDEANPGLMKAGTQGVYPCFKLEYWCSDDLSDIEHIAPMKPRKDSDWDENIYIDELYQSVGNLTLLPEEINESVSNRGWLEKYYYYQHLAESSPDRVLLLAEEAKVDGISLKESVITRLRSAKHNRHILPIVNAGKDTAWDAAMIQKRTERICELLWSTLIQWLA